MRWENFGERARRRHGSHRTFVTNADIVNGTIKGKKLKAGTVTAAQLTGTIANAQLGSNPTLSGSGTAPLRPVIALHFCTTF